MKPSKFIVGIAAGSMLSALVLGAILVAVTAHPDPGIRDDDMGLPPPAILAAQAWFEANGTSLATFQAMPIEERAKRLTKAVYSWCQNGDGPANQDELFEQCVAQCGGYAYVLRGLLEATGAETRFLNLHNIPNQGNHTAVDVRVGARWAFFDPTFGVYFTEDGDPDSRVLSASEIAYDVAEEELGTRVAQTEKGPQDFVTLPLDELFDERFEHAYMQLSSYQTAERISPVDPEIQVALDIPLVLSRGHAAFGSVEVLDFVEMEAEWLRQTNASISDRDELNDTSFNSSRLHNVSSRKLTTISLFGLTAEKEYVLRLVFYSPEAARIQIGGIGKSVQVSLPAQTRLVPGATVIETPFRVRRQTAQFIVRSMEHEGLVHLFGVAVKPAEAH